VGFPVLTRWLGITWQKKQRDITDPNAPLHETVYERLAAPGVQQYDLVQPYRPEGLRRHIRLHGYYKDIPEPPMQFGLLGYIKSFFLGS
jgi:hypothetical protein